MKGSPNLRLKLFVGAILAIILLPGGWPALPGAAAALGADLRPAIPAAAGPVNLLAVADTTLKSGFPNANFGGTDTLDLEYAGGGRNIARILLRFDLATGLPSGAVVDSAQLQVRLNSGTGVSPIAVRASKVTTDWSELGVTWNTAPLITDPRADAQVGTTQGWVTWDVTAIARAWQTGRNYGLELRGPESGADWYRTFRSRHPVEAEPRLVVTYHLSATATPTVTRTPTATQTRTHTPTATPTVTRTPTATPASCTEVQIAADADSWTDQSQPSTAHGTETSLNVGKIAPAPGNRAALMHFNIHFNALPAGAWIERAALELYQTAATGPAQFGVWVDAVTGKTWNWSESTVTWANMPAAVDAGVPPLQVQSSTIGWRRWNVTGLVQQWAAGDRPVAGVQLRGDGATEGMRTFAARETSTPPRLVVCYRLDTTPPTNPNSFTADHLVDQWSNDPSISGHWDGASDGAGSGIYGYSVEWSSSKTILPDAVVDTTTHQDTHQLGEGSWYVHVRTRDVAGNWNAGAAHFGPYKIDLTPPEDPLISSTSHTELLWSNNPTVLMSWSGAADGTGSGVAGYSFQWDAAPMTVPDTTVDTSGSTASSLRPDGTTYFHLRTKDVAGNWSGATHYGPIGIDTVAPINPTLSSPSHLLGVWTDNTLLEIYGSSAADNGGSGIGGYSYVLDNNSATWPTQAVTSQAFDTYKVTVSYGVWYFHIRTVDQVGNWSNAAHFGPINVDDRGEIWIGHIRLTQGLETDVSGGVFYDLISGKDTLARFSLYSTQAPLTVTGTSCDIVEVRKGQMIYRGSVPGEWASGGGSDLVRPPIDPNDMGAVVNCWIPGAMVSSDDASAVFVVSAHVFDRKVHDWGGWLSTHEFRQTARYLGWLIYEAFADPATWPAGGPQPLTADDPAVWSQLLKQTLPSLQRLWPLKAGIEQIRLDGSNAHTAGLRFYIAPETYTCGKLEQDSPLIPPNQTDPDPGYTCDAHQRAAADQFLALFNLVAEVKQIVDGDTFEKLQWGTVVVPFDVSGGGQSCWEGSRVASQGISATTNNLDGWVMAHEPAHCLGLVANDSPHILAPDSRHAKQDWIQVLPDQPMVSFRVKQDFYVTAPVMVPIGSPGLDDSSMMEGWEWNQLRKKIRDYGWTTTAGQTAAAPAGEKRFFLMGQVDRADAWITAYSMLVDQPIPVSPKPTSGQYAVLVLNGSGTELVRWPFDVAFGAADGLPGSFAQLAFTLPYPDGAARVRVVHGAQVLAELTPPAAGPAVRVDQLTLDGNKVHVAWTGSHPGGATLTYALYFSPDDGATRIPLATSVKATTYDWLTRLTQGTEQARLIVVGSDGFHTAEAVSSRFSIPRRAPIAGIGQPGGTSAEVVAGQRIDLLGSALDLNDGLLSGESLRWSSDLQGSLGSGERVAVMLSPGTHRIVLQATSSAGLVGSASVTVTALLDTDEDGLSDLYERAHACLDPLNAADRDQDQDGDGLAARREAELDTQPCVADTDRDGVSDGRELAGGSNPLDPKSRPLPILAAQPDQLNFVGCGVLPAPAAQTIALVDVDVVYEAVTDAAWLGAARQPDGRLQIGVDCRSVPALWAALPVRGAVLVRATGRRPLIIEVKLTPGLRTYLPVLLRSTR